MAARAVISDVSIYTTPMTSDEFDFWMVEKAPPGYQVFRRYIDGDYEYQESLMKVTLAATNGNTPQMQGTTMVVDVPDLTDRGTATIPAAETTVNFNKTFSSVQEVVATVKSGTTAAAVDIVSVSTTGFNVQLRDPGGSGNNLTAGDISWIARGY